MNDIQEMEKVSLEETDTEMTAEQEAEFRHKVFAGEAGESETAIADVEEPAEVQEKGSEVPVEVKDDPPVEEEADPWAGVPPAVKAMYDKMEGRVKQAERRIGSFEPDIVDVRNAKKEAAEKAAAPSEEEIAEAAKSKEDLAKLIEDYPEWGNVINDQFNAIRKELDPKALKAEIAALKETVEKSGGSAGDFQVALVDFFQPGWPEKVYSDAERKTFTPEFGAWFKDQPDEMKAKLGSDFANDALDVLDAFDSSETGTPQKTPTEIAEARRKKVKAAVLPDKERSDAPKPEEHLSEQEFRKKAADEAFGRNK